MKNKLVDLVTDGVILIEVTLNYIFNIFKKVFLFFSSRAKKRLSSSKVGCFIGLHDYDFIGDTKEGYLFYTCKKCGKVVIL